MSSVEKRVGVDGAITWQARWRDPDGTAKKKTFRLKTHATQHLTKVEESMLSGSYIDPGRSKVTVGEWARRWLADQVHLKPSTAARYNGVVNNHVLPRWERVPLAAVTHADVSSWIASLTPSGQSPSSVRQIHRVFSLILKLAVKDRRLTFNPAADVSLPTITAGEMHFLTHRQVYDLAAASGEYGLAVLVLAYTGLRFGELAALRVKRVDLIKRRLDIAEAVTTVDGKLVWGLPKTHQVRWVPLPAFLVPALAAHIAGRGPDELVFTANRGATLRVGNFQRNVFTPAARAAGIPSGATTHDLRHTAASLAIQAGANVKVVQRMLGHKSAAVTLDVYSGLFEVDLDGLAERLEERRREALQIDGKPAVRALAS